MEKSNTSNPIEFWKSIENLGPRKKHKIPMEVEMKDGTFSDAFDDVMYRWKQDFQELLTPPPPDSDTQLNFQEEITHSNEETEASWNEDNTNACLNLPFTKSEVG